LVQQFVVRVSEGGGHNAAAEFKEVTRIIGPAPAVAVLMMTSRYMAHAIIVNTLELAPPTLAISQGQNR
jgi:hypothetical protein